MVLYVTSVANIQNFYLLHNKYLGFLVMASFLSIVKTTVFTRLYLDPWCEHSFETNMGVADQIGQHIPVVKSLRE